MYALHYKHGCMQMHTHTHTHTHTQGTLNGEYSKLQHPEGEGYSVLQHPGLHGNKVVCDIQVIVTSWVTSDSPYHMLPMM